MNAKYLWVDQDVETEYRTVDGTVEFRNVLGNWTPSRFATINDVCREACINGASFHPVTTDDPGFAIDMAEYRMAER